MSTSTTPTTAPGLTERVIDRMSREYAGRGVEPDPRLTRPPLRMDALYGMCQSLGLSIVEVIRTAETPA